MSPKHIEGRHGPLHWLFETSLLLKGVFAALEAVAGAVLVWVAAYHVADAVQTLCVFVLRSYRVTIAPLVVYCLLLWGAGLGGGYVLAYHGFGPWAPMGSPAPFWAASALALAITAGLFVLMLWVAIRPAAQGDEAGSRET